MLRKIVEIDEARCDGCGLCVPSCAEGAIKIMNGKAVLSAEKLCDGLGACLGECPKDAIRVVEREADPFDEKAVEQHLEDSRSSCSQVSASSVAHGTSPNSYALKVGAHTVTADNSHRPSRLGQWPVQLHLVPVSAPYFQNADLLVVADCVPFAYPEFHNDFLCGRALVVGCPKLDDNRFYHEKLSEILKASTIRSVTVLRMEVPCCGGIVSAARQAIVTSGKSIPFSEIVIGINGEIMR